MVDDGMLIALQPFEDPNATFIRSATFRSTDHAHMQKVSEQITNLRKAQNKRENDRKELADVVEQEKLIEIKGKMMVTICDIVLTPSRPTTAQADRCPHSTGIGRQAYRTGRGRTSRQRSAILCPERQQSR